MSGLNIQSEIQTLAMYLDGRLFRSQEVYGALQTRASFRKASVKMTTKRVVQVLGTMVSTGTLNQIWRQGLPFYSHPGKARAIIAKPWVAECQAGNWIRIGNNAA